MKQLKMSIAALLIFSVTASAQTKKDTLPPPPPSLPKVVTVEKPAPPPPPELPKGHPWTKNGEDIWVMKPARPAKLVKPLPPPPPPPPPAKKEKK